MEVTVINLVKMQPDQVKHSNFSGRHAQLCLYVVRVAVLGFLRLATAS